MPRTLRLFAMVLVWLLAVHASSRAAGEADEGAFRLDVELGPLVVQRVDGHDVVSATGFRSGRRPGAPDLPRQTFLVAIPPGSEPRLEVRFKGEGRRRGVRPRPVPQSVSRLSEEDLEQLDRADLSPQRRLEVLTRRETSLRVEDPEIYERKAYYPDQVAWLGEIGVLRDQRYVEVHVAPVRYDGRDKSLQTFDRLELIVHFGIAVTAAEPASPVGSPFEDIYRRTFANYAQGRRFRLEGKPARTGSTGRGQQSIGPRYRLTVRESGLYRLDHALLSASGFAAHPVAQWRLTTRGVQVPLHILDDGDGLIETGEWVQFWGQILDDEPHTALNLDITSDPADLYEDRDFSDEGVYFLTVEQSNQPAMPTRASAPTVQTPAADFEAVVHLEQDDAYWPMGAADPWYWNPSTGSTAGASQRTVSVALPGLADPTAPLQVRLNLRGLSPFSIEQDEMVDPDHLTRVRLFNDQAQQLAIDDAAFDGLVEYTHDFGWTHQVAGPEASDPVDVRLEALSIGSLPNTVILNWIEVAYRREFRAIDNSLVFDYPNGVAEFFVEDVTVPRVYELTDKVSGVIQAVRLTGTSTQGGGVRFHVDAHPQLAGGAPRRFAVVGSSAVYNVVAGPDFLPDAVSDLRSNANQADLIVIAHPDLVGPCHTTNPPCPPTDPLAALLAHRQSPQGGGLATKLVLLEDVEDEFNDGFPGPLAIRNFMSWIFSDAPGEGWAAPRPSYLLLLGDGSFGYKGGATTGSLVPTQMLFKNVFRLGYYASDNILGAVIGGDPLPELMIGRIPVRTRAEADVVLEKILNYELQPEPGSWRSHAALISDRGANGLEIVEAAEFELINDGAIEFMQAPPYTASHLRYYDDHFVIHCPTLPCSPANTTAAAGDMLDAILSEVNDPGGGVALLQYVGHGNFQVWSNDAFFSENQGPPDTELLMNGDRTPWLLAHNCLTGGFHWYNYVNLDRRSMAEDWLLRSGGGAVAALSPSGLSFNYVSDVASDTVWSSVFGRRKERRIGVPTMETWIELCGFEGTVEACQQYVLLGDPAMRLMLPTVEPPRDVAAAAGNGQVTLTWTESLTEAVTYTVYRSVGHTGQFVLRAQGIGDETYTDTGLNNLQTYYYAVTAVDAGGFESRWSHLHTDCEAPDPQDCLFAVPVNPIPPTAPAGLVVSDARNGSELDLTWSANAEPDILGYTAHYGTSPGVYPSSVSMGKATSGRLGGLVEGQTYHVVLTATNDSGLTSDASGPASGTPHYAPGLALPAFIDTLRVVAAGNDVRLQWDEVTQDVWETPVAVTRYEIFRSTSPGFVVAGADLAPFKIDECTSPCDEYIDIGARVAPASYYYSLRAVGAPGDYGPLGSDVPDAVDVSAAPTASPGEYQLWWDPVEQTVGGSAVDLLHYAVYTDSLPVSREAIRDGALVPLATTTGTSVLVTPPAGNRYYSVLAVDVRGNASPY